jgi:hypothetical protein
MAFETPMSCELLLALGPALLASATWTGLRHRHDLDAARERISGRSQVMQTRWGRLEYALAGGAEVRRC